MPHPNISLFNSHANRHDPFAKFDYMGVLPTKSALVSFMRLCDSIRANKIKLPPEFLKSERRAYKALRDHKYVTTDYPWVNAVTDCWLTTPYTWWADLQKQIKKWRQQERNSG